MICAVLGFHIGEKLNTKVIKASVLNCNIIKAFSDFINLKDLY